MAHECVRPTVWSGPGTQELPVLLLDSSRRRWSHGQEQQRAWDCSIAHTTSSSRLSSVTLWLLLPHEALAMAEEEVMIGVVPAAAAGVSRVHHQGKSKTKNTQEEEVGVCRQLCEDEGGGNTLSAALTSLSRLVRQGYRVPNNLFYRLLKRCASQPDPLALARRVHALAVEGGYQGDSFLGTHLIGLYASHGQADEATQVFATLRAPSVYAWSAIILALARHGDPAEAVRLYRHMRRTGGVRPDNRVYSAVVKACAAAGDVAAGREVHSHILAEEEASVVDVFVQCGLVDMYAKCGCLREARCVLDAVPAAARTVVAWTSMIAGYAQQGQGEEALRLYAAMRDEGRCAPNSVTFVALLQACASMGAAGLARGEHVHAEMEMMVVDEAQRVDAVVLGCSLVNMYAKCGSLDRARAVLDGLPERNVVTWTTMMAAYAQQGMGHQALALYRDMQQQQQQQGVVVGSRSPGPSSVTLLALLQACATVGAAALEQGRQLHALVVVGAQQHPDSDDDGVAVAVAASLVNMYTKCGSLEDARRVFDGLPDAKKNVVTWNAMIGGYAAQPGMGREALRLYAAMRQQHHADAASAVTFVSLLQACAGMGVEGLHHGMQVHAQIRERGLLLLMHQGGAADAHDCVALGGSLVNMYAKCGSVEQARSVFDALGDGRRNTVTWNAMLAGYAQRGLGREALALYDHSRKGGTGDGGLLVPDSVSFVTLLQACASVGIPALDRGKQLHAHIQRTLLLEEDVVVGGSLVNMYAKCGSLEDARAVFDRLPHKNVVTWNAMILGYTQHGLGQEALALYACMARQDLPPPDTVTLVCLLQACAATASLALGRHIHAHIARHALLLPLPPPHSDNTSSVSALGAALVNMYAKCGSMGDAQCVFDSLPSSGPGRRTVEAWGALIAGYSAQGDAGAVFALHHRMADGASPAADAADAAPPPNGVTFLSVLAVCVHAGLVDKGIHCFRAMTARHGVPPALEHYICLVDLLGRAGRLADAVQVAERMPLPPTADVWHTILSACRKWGGNVEVAVRAFRAAVGADDKDAAAYVLMANVYARAGMWEQAREVQARRTGCGAWKKPGQCWWTDAAGQVHAFAVGGGAGDAGEASDGQPRTAHAHAHAGVYAALEQLLLGMQEEEAEFVTAPSLGCKSRRMQRDSSRRLFG